MLTNKTPEQVLLLMCKTTAQTPMTDGQIASLLDTKREHVNDLLDQLYECKAISSVKNIKGGIEQRLVWVTGLPCRPITPTPKEIAWQHLRTQQNKSQQETTMDDQPKAVLIVPTNLNEAGIKTPQKIVRLLFANTKVTSNEIRKACNLQYVDPFIKAYVRKGYIDRVIDDSKLAVYSITPKGRLLGSADALYNHAKVKHPSKLGEATSNDESVFAHIAAQKEAIAENQRRFKAEQIKPTLEDRQALDKVFDKLIAEEKANIELTPEAKPLEIINVIDTNGIKEVLDKINPDDLNKIILDKHKNIIDDLGHDKADDINIIIEKAYLASKNEPQPDHEPVNPVRFALTDDGTLMILGVHYLPIELSKADTKRLYEFAENTVHAI